MEYVEKYTFPFLQMSQTSKDLSLKKLILSPISPVEK